MEGGGRPAVGILAAAAMWVDILVSDEPLSSWRAQFLLPSVYSRAVLAGRA